MNPKIEIIELDTKTLLYRIPELLRHRGFDRAALTTQILHTERRSITADDLRRLARTERVEIHAALAIVGGTMLQMQDELPHVDIPEAMRLIRDSIRACDDVAVTPLIAAMQPPTDGVH